MTEGMPLTADQFRRLNRDLMEKVLAKAASDPEWKERLLDDPEAAMIAADFPEIRELQEMQASVKAQEEEAEVAGHLIPGLFMTNPKQDLFCNCMKYTECINTGH